MKENVIYAIGGIDIELFKETDKLKMSLGTKCPGETSSWPTNWSI